MLNHFKLLLKLSKWAILQYELRMSVYAIKGFKCLHKMIAYIKGSLWVHKSEWNYRK